MKFLAKLAWFELFDWLQFLWQGIRLLFGFRDRESDGSLRSTAELIGGLIGLLFVLIVVGMALASLLE